MMPSPYKLTATQVLELLKNNTLTVEAYASSLLDRIQAHDSTVKAWAYLDPELVLSQARALDQIPDAQRGPLHGVAIGVKDIMNTEDMPTQFGSPIYKGHQPRFDSSAVAILRAAGALIFGKTTTTEFAVTNSGPNTTNPHDPDRTPGGSSCGSAAAVADFHVPLSLGAQTGGGIIRPASFTGVFAMKPTFNAISVEGHKPFAPSFDTFGFFARGVEDLQLLADVFALQDDNPLQDMPLEKTSVALMKTPLWSLAGPGTVSAMEEAAEILKNSGAKVQEVAFPPEVADGPGLRRILKVIVLGEAQACLLREYQIGKESLAQEICDIVENTSNGTREGLVRASETCASMREIVNDLADNYSVILTPSAVDEAPLGLSDMGRAHFNTMWTGFHMPIINVPAFVGANGMPVGISLVAPRFRDQQLLRTSRVLGEKLMAQGGWKLSSRVKCVGKWDFYGCHCGDRDSESQEESGCEGGDCDSQSQEESGCEGGDCDSQSQEESGCDGGDCDSQSQEEIRL
ncbi:amidase signature domain-containing protein [Ilyonectria robusta]|uniref:amidase signature domain-containing protein n=1 Tax=Ilyonectria robusta TaxID=1079257 RepID=UPI001E8DE753|nr:amidase signature domain-containing protein [Ilyonectria robusta]KAH8685005.1 amidase signature domain-containing protein [Ilyonectria robusta]